MLAAKVALQPLQRGAARFLQQQARALHAPPPRPAAASNFTNRLQALLRWTIGRLATNSNTIYSKGSPLASRSFSRLQPRVNIQQTWSFPTRVMLSRPLGSPFMLRPPAVPRTMTQVGLGTARTFATSRPIFANLVENVPVAARAFQEAGWDIKDPPVAKAVLKKHRKSKSRKTARSVQKPVRESVFGATISEDNAFDTYFAPGHTSSVMTVLDVPLAPSSGISFGVSAALPAIVADLTAAHGTHSIKVASIFRRLDAAKIWKNGAEVEVLGGADGVAAAIRVRFHGWAAEDVRAVIGEAGSGWCTMLEERTPLSGLTTPSTVFSPLPTSSPSSILNSPLASQAQSPHNSRPSSAMSIADLNSASFIMPTLDFSSSFLAAHEDAWASDTDEPAASLARHQRYGYSSDSDDSVWSVHSAVSVNSGVTFSSEHWRRVAAFVGDF